MAEGNENSNTLAQLQTNKINKLLSEQKFGNPYKSLVDDCKKSLDNLNKRISDIQKGNDEISGLLSAANATVDEYIDSLNQELDAINADQTVKNFYIQKQELAVRRSELDSEISKKEKQIETYQKLSSHPRTQPGSYKNIIASLTKEIDDIRSEYKKLSDQITRMDEQIGRNKNTERKKDLTDKLTKAENYRDSVQKELDYFKDRLEKQQNQCNELSKLCADFNFNPNNQSAFFNFLSRKWP